MEEIKNVLVTGNKGYIGSVLTEILLEKGYSVTGLDTGFYEPLYETKQNIKQITKDIRDISEEDLGSIDAVIHLAALSNDPLGELNKNLTKEINFISTVRLVRLAKKSGIKRFIYSSSQSMYGIADEDSEVEEDKGNKNPITEYAKTKWLAEQEIKKFCSDNFTVVCFRPSTVFGASPALRCDIVFNNLIASGYTSGNIEVKSDGTPWRPVVHVRDVSSAFIAGLEAPKELVSNESFNVGIKDGNYTVKDLAEAAQKVLGNNCGLTFNTKFSNDERTYRVSFDKILTKLKDYYKPEWDLEKGGKELVDFFNKIDFNEDTFKGRKTIRISQLKHLIEDKKLDKNLYWKKINLRQAVILAGGMGSRLKPLTDNIPKPMLDINGKPYLTYLIDYLKEEGIEEVLILLGYLPNKIKEYFGDGSKFGVNIKYSIGDISFGSAKRIKNAEDLLDENFLLMYCDNYCPIKIDKLRRFHEKQGKLMTMSIYPNKDNFTKNNVLVNNSLIEKYDKKREYSGLNCVDIGFFIVNKKVVSEMPDDNDLMLYEIFPSLIEKKQLAGYKAEHRYCGLSKIERLPIVKDFFNQRKIIFLDRDGVINKKSKRGDYIKNWSEFEFLPGVTEAISILTKKGYEIYIITNQPGIAKGVMTETDLTDIHSKMIDEINKKNGKINVIYYCPHNLEDNCYCRKPNPGLLFKAQRENNINLRNVLFIGDDERDIEAADAADVDSLLIESDEGLLDAVKKL